MKFTGMFINGFTVSYICSGAGYGFTDWQLLLPLAVVTVGNVLIDIGSSK